MMNPLVSICVPTYNGEKYLLDALESVRHQTYENIEVVVSDDNSKDKTLQVVAEFKNLVKIPVHIYSHEPSGIGANWNNCVRKANGDYIKFLFQDDILNSDCIQKMVEMAIKQKNVGLVYSKRSIIYDVPKQSYLEWSKRYGHLHEHWEDMVIEEGIMDGFNYLKNRKIFHFPSNKIGEPTAVLLKKECFSKVGFFRTDLKQELDVEFWFRIMKYYKVGFINRFLVSFRLHEKQTTVLNRNAGIQDNDLLPKIYLSSIFWYLNFKVQRELLMKTTRNFLK